MNKTKQSGAYTVAAFIWGLLSALLLWQLLSWLITSPALPSPMASIKACIEFYPELNAHLFVSLYRVSLSLALGLLIGYPLALFTARNPWIDKVFAPFLYIVYPIPKVVFLPVLFVLLGIADAPKIALITLTIAFQVTVTQRDALQHIDESLILSARSMGANKWQLYTQVYIPASLPALFTALRITCGTAIAVLFISESVAGTTGLGYYIVNAWGLVNYPQMFAGILYMSVLGLIMYELIHVFEFFACGNKYKRS